MAAVASLGALFFAARSLSELEQQRERQFETIFVERYWTPIDDLSLAAIKGRPQVAIDPTDEKIVLQYFRLSEDELELHADGWISERTWLVWREDMIAQINRWPFLVVWQEISETHDYALLRKLTRSEAAAVGHEGDAAAV